MRSILVIEDDESIRQNLYDLLDIHGYKVLTAENGREGINFALKNEPDLIICDIMMPVLDGWKVKEFLSLNDSTKFIPFIFLTAKGEMKDIRNGMNMGADDYIVKPYHIDDLLRSIEVRIDKFDELKNNISQDTGKTAKYSEDKILITHNGSPKLINFSEIIYIKSNGNYTNLKMKDNKKIFVRKLIKDWENILPSNNFLRIHQSYIINLNYLDKFEKFSKKNLIVKLKGIDDIFPISQRYAKNVRDRFRY